MAFESIVDPEQASGRNVTALCGFSMAMARYAQHFPVVEVQATFYEPPADAVLLQLEKSQPVEGAVGEKVPESLT